MRKAIGQQFLQREIIKPVFRVAKWRRRRLLKNQWCSGRGRHCRVRHCRRFADCGRLGNKMMMPLGQRPDFRASS